MINGVSPLALAGAGGLNTKDAKGAKGMGEDGVNGTQAA